MKMDKAKKNSGREPSEQSLIENLAESVTFVLKEQLKNCKDPFEAYVYRLKFRMHKDGKLFKERFAKGYAVLMEQLGKKVKKG